MSAYSEKLIPVNKFDVDAVIFDLGSTLLEYENIPWVTLNLNCLKNGYEFLKGKGLHVPPMEEFTNTYMKIRDHFREKSAATLREYVVTEPIKILLETTVSDGDVGMAERFFDAYYKPVSSQLSIFADTVTVLNEIKNKDKIIGLVSNTIFPRDYHLAELKKYGIIDCFDFTLFSSSFGYRKPHHKIYAEALRFTALPPEKNLFIGDRYLEDYQGPMENGLKAILKYRKGREYPDPLPESVVMVKSLSDILPLI
jgi:putative hydrolase of the HAD superfamily